jgi:hypothetical protein
VAADLGGVTPHDLGHPSPAPDPYGGNATFLALIDWDEAIDGSSCRT